MQYYSNTSVETPTTRFQQLLFNILCEDAYSQLWACQVVGANHQQSSNIFTIQGKVTGIICRALTPKDKERYSSTLTKQNARGLGLYVELSHLKTRKEIQATLQRDMRGKT